jgi:hypothetical protein
MGTENGGNLLLNPVQVNSDGYSIDATFYPNVDNTYKLGTDTNRWGSVSVGPGSLHIIAKNTDAGFGDNFDFKFAIDSATGNLQIIGNNNILLEANPISGVTIVGNVLAKTEQYPINHAILQSLDGYIPYTGATGNVTLGNNNLAVGLGATPVYPLMVKNTGLTNLASFGNEFADGGISNVLVQIETNQSAGNYAGISLQRSGNTAGYVTVMQNGINIGATADGSTPQLFVGSAGSQNEKVGIGTTSPTHTLDVVGNTHISTDLSVDGGIINAALKTALDGYATKFDVTFFGAVGDGVTDDTIAIQNTIDYVDSLGGGEVFFPAGTYATTTGIVVGNGSNSAPSSVHNKIRLVGMGYGGSTGIINQQVNGTSRILYTGSPDANAAVLTFAGPIYGNQVENITLDCDAKAGRGVIINHLTMGTFNRVSVRNYAAVGFDLTTRTGFPSGCAFGCGDNRFYGCYGWADDASLASSTIIGISLDSGVSTGTSLVGKPDSARNVFIGGTFMYGTTASSYGMYLSGADNNTVLEVQFFPYGGSTSGYDIYLNQWPASGNWPMENYFSNLGMTRGVSGNSGIGSGWGNTFFPFPTSDGAIFPALTGASGVDHFGKTYVAGVRAYRGRQSDSAALNNSVQSNSTMSIIDVPGLSVTMTTLSDSKLRVSFSGRATKVTSGTGLFFLGVNGSAQGETRTDVNSDGLWHTVSGEGLFAVGVGSQTITVQFASGDTNAVEISHGVLVVEELY